VILAALLALAVDTVRVSAGDPGALARAVAAAPAGSVVLAGPAAWTGPLRVERALTVVGAPGAVVRGTGSGSVVLVLAPGVRLAGFVIEHSGRDPDRDDAGVMVAAPDAVLEDLEIRDVHHGVYLLQAPRTVIRRVRIRGREEPNANARGDGIHFYWSPGSVADSADIAGVRDGLFFQYSDSTLVRGTTVTRSRYGLHYMFSHGNRFEGNRFTSCTAGSSIMNSRDVVARDNVFAWNHGVAAYGLLLQSVQGTVLERNAFVGNGTGLYVDGAVDGVLRDNLVAGNFIGLQLFPSSRGNRITGNHVTGNTYPATGGAADSRFCVDGRGNRWDGDGGWDLDRDGVQDVPYSPATPLTEVSRERPALRLFLASPAAAVLGWAERVLPVFQLQAVVDSCPLAVAGPAVPSLPAATAVPPAAPRASRLVAASLLALGLGGLLAARPVDRW
jgi:nitrous oxidase accessory protein